MEVLEKIIIKYFHLTLSMVIITLWLSLAGCSKGAIESPDLGQTDLLPKRSDYLEKDYGTQALAKKLNGIFHSEIGLVFFDEETRTQPQLYLTRGEQNIHFDAQPDGSLLMSYKRFNTPFMPLYMSASIKTLVTERNDTIFLRGTDGKIRTEGDENTPIGTPFPESDDAELEGIYIPATRKLGMVIDLMLPLPIKALIKGEKENE